MKKILAVTLIASLFATAAFANPAINGKHAGKKNGEKAVNCVYCHTDAGIAKTKGQDAAALQKGATCAIAGCHVK